MSYFESWAESVSRAFRSYVAVSDALLRSRVYHDTRRRAEFSSGDGEQVAVTVPLLWGTF